MKKILVIVLVMISQLSFATTIKVYEAPAYDFKPSYDPFSYGINRELGRAWLSFYETDSTFDEPTSHTTDIKVPGLSYDNKAETVVYRNGSQEIVCAETVVKGRIFKKSVLVPTGRCSFDIEYVNYQHDDGFNVKTVKYGQIYFTAE